MEPTTEALLIPTGFSGNAPESEWELEQAALPFRLSRRPMHALGERKVIKEVMAGFCLLASFVHFES